MDIRTQYPDFAAVEEHVRRAHAERSLVLGQMFADLAVAIGRGLKNLAASMQRGYEAERDRRAIEADAFLKRSVPRY